MITIDENSPDIKEVLGLMIFTTGPIAHALRNHGHVIPRRAEDEQVAVILWLLKMVQDHGPDWRKHAAEFL
jgi:hypothetical protein